MKFTFEIPDSEWFEGCELYDFKEMIKSEAIMEVVSKVTDIDYGNLNSEIRSLVREFISENRSEIIKDVTDRVTEEILNRKESYALMPKKSEVNAVSKEWKDYFKQMIDESAEKAVKAKFKKIIGY